MAKEDTIAAIFLGLLGLGGTAMIAFAPTVFPNNEALFFWVGVVLVIISLAGLTWCFISFLKEKKMKKETPVNPPTPRSAFIRGDNIGKISIEESTSSADDFFDVKNTDEITSKKNTHTPSKG
ncbi:hypothetical protein [Parasphingorhabdus sp. NYA22]